MGMVKEQHQDLLIAQTALLRSVAALPDTPECNLVKNLAVEYYEAHNEYIRALSQEASAVLDNLQPERKLQ